MKGETLNRYRGIERIDFTLREGKLGYRRISFELRDDGRFDRWYGPTFAYEMHEPSGPLSHLESASLISSLEEAKVLSWRGSVRRLDCLDGIEWTLSLEFEDGTFCRRLGVNDFPEDFEVVFEVMTALGLPMPEFD